MKWFNKKSNNSHIDEEIFLKLSDMEKRMSDISEANDQMMAKLMAASMHEWAVDMLRTENSNLKMQLSDLTTTAFKMKSLLEELGVEFDTLS